MLRESARASERERERERARESESESERERERERGGRRKDPEAWARGSFVSQASPRQPPDSIKLCSLLHHALAQRAEILFLSLN